MWCILSETILLGLHTNRPIPGPLFFFFFFFSVFVTEINLDSDMVENQLYTDQQNFVFFLSN